MKIPKISTLVAICVAVIVAIIILPKIFPVLGGNFVWVLLLACPLMHIFMMKGHGHDDDHADNSAHPASHSCCQPTPEKETKDKL